MRFIAFLNSNGQPSLGLRDGSGLVDLTEAGLPSTLDEFLRGGDHSLAAARKIASRSTTRIELSSITYLPPLVNPSKAFAIGLNYIEHAAESKHELPKDPVIFQRFPTSWVAHKQPLVRPKVSLQFDYEAELVVVIGREGRYIPKERALEHVAGYSIFNDGTIRDYQFRTGQWLWGKNFDASGGFGPELVTVDELPLGAKGLGITLRLNGKVLQNANTRDMIFDVATLVAACSEAMTLRPGDMIITGTPSGVGMARQPQIWMEPGDVCEVEIENIGVLSNEIVGEAEK